MSSVAESLQRSTVHHEVGSLARVEDSCLVVTAVGGEYRARRAPSCLVAPEAGDFVLLASTPTGGCFVVAVLERDAARPTTLTAEGDLDVRLAGGRFTVAAQQDVTLEAERTLQLTAPAVEVRAVDGSVHAQNLSIVSTRVRAEIQRVKSVARTVESVIGLLTERAKRVYRRVEEFEHVRAENLDYEAKSTLSLHAENTVIEADELVKVDGDQIHLG